MLADKNNRSIPRRAGNVAPLVRRKQHVAFGGDGVEAAIRKQQHANNTQPIKLPLMVGHVLPFWIIARVEAAHFLV